MADVFVSYLPEESERVGPLVKGLEDAGLSVWWDTAGGDNWREVLARELSEASCVVVVWTEQSVELTSCNYVLDLAERAAGRDALLPVLLDRVKPPIGFGGIRALPLHRWSGSPDDEAFLDVRDGAQAIVAGVRRPTPRPIKRRRWTLASATTLLLTTAGAIGDVEGAQGAVCMLPGAYSACQRFGFGGVPGVEEELLWKSRKDGDCDTLKTYLQRYPTGVFVEEAKNVLEHGPTRKDWMPRKREFPLFVPFDDKATFQRRKDAEAEVHERAKTGAAGLCATHLGNSKRLQPARGVRSSFRPAPRFPKCTETDKGFGCELEGHAVCAYEIEVERPACLVGQ